MKIKNGFVMNKVGSQFVVVPVGEASTQRHCMIRLNDTGAFLWSALQTETSQPELIAAFQREFEGSPEEAAAYVADFVNDLRAADLLEESDAELASGYDAASSGASDAASLGARAADLLEESE